MLLQSSPSSSHKLSFLLLSLLFKMWPSFFSFFNEIRTLDAKPLVGNKRVGVCKDEEGQEPLQPKAMKSKATKKVRFETKPLVCDMENGNQKAELKVKILMTKEEAARLLSKCKDGGRLEFKDVARELVQIPINRVNLVSSRDNCLIEGIDQKEH